MARAVFELHFNGVVTAFLDFSECAVHPPTFRVIFYEYHLGVSLQDQFHRCRERAFREVSALYAAVGVFRRTEQHQVLFVDMVYHVAACGQGHGHRHIACICA